MPFSPLVYLKKELKFSVAEWAALPEKDQNDLRNWAIEEARVLGLLDTE